MDRSRLCPVNAEVKSAVVKLLKNTGIPIFFTKLFYLFLLSIEKIRKSLTKVCHGCSAKAAEHLCMPAKRTA